MSGFIYGADIYGLGIYSWYAVWEVRVCDPGMVKEKTASRFGSHRYSQYRYSWLTTWASKACYGSTTVTAPQLGMVSYGSNSVLAAGQAQRWRPGNFQSLGKRSQLQLRQAR